MIRDRSVVRQGRLPTAAGEAALSTELAQAFDARVGDTLHLDELDTEVGVVGIADTVGRNDRELLLAASRRSIPPRCAASSTSAARVASRRPRRPRWRR